MNSSNLALVLSLALITPQLMAQEPQPTNTYVIEAEGKFPADLSGLVSEAGGVLLRVHKEINIAVAQSDDPNFVGNLEGSGAIRRATQDLSVQWVPSADELGLQIDEAPSAEGHGGNPAAAFFFPCQWNLAQCDVPGAWAQDQFGDPSVKVAVLDTGTDPTHLDLAGRIDAANSRTFVTSSPCGVLDTASFLDRHFHGAFVSGIITANGIGVAGVAPLAKIVGVKVVDCLGGGTFADIIAGLLYAASLPDVDVINMSLGFSFPKNGAGTLVAALNKAVNFANGKGKLVVSGAGNSAVDMDHDKNFIHVPAQSGAGIAAWAGNIDGALASYSNHGISGTLVGAGGGDNTPGSPAIPLPGCPLPNALQDGILSVCSSFSIFFGCESGTVYLRGSGTSFSTPLVSGVAALVDGKHSGSKNAGQLKTILSQTADDLGKQGVDNDFSHGRVNAGRAVTK